nr:YoaK family protein [Microbacterium aquimaris]
MSRRGLASAAGLALFAGIVDGYGFTALGGFFVSFMTGNTTRAGVEAVQGHLPAALFALGLIVSFVIGAAIGSAISSARAHPEARVLGLVLAGLVVAAAASSFGAAHVMGCALALSMGATNTVFSRGGDISFGVTYMTGALVKLAQALVAATRGGSRTAWARHAVLWSSIALGAVLGSIAATTLGSPALWGLALVITTAIVVLFVRRRRDGQEPVGPAGAST